MRDCDRRAGKGALDDGFTQDFERWGENIVLMREGSN
jgi:hypothetical protein